MPLETKDWPQLRPAPHTDAIVDRWVAEKLGNSPLSRNQACWNFLQDSLADLKFRLAKSITAASEI